MTKVSFKTKNNMNKIHDRIQNKIPEFFTFRNDRETFPNGYFTSSLIVEEELDGIRFTFPDDEIIHLEKIEKAVKFFDLGFISRLISR